MLLIIELFFTIASTVAPWATVRFDLLISSSIASVTAALCAAHTVSAAVTGIDELGRVSVAMSKAPFVQVCDVRDIRLVAVLMLLRPSEGSAVCVVNNLIL